MSGGSKIHVMIVDDHAVVRKGLALVLRLAEEIEVVGEAGSPAEAMPLVKQLKPDIILLDRIMPDSTPQSNVRMLREAAPDSHIIMLTGTELDEEVISILKSGVDGYILKEIEPAELIRAIKVVASGDAYLQPSVARHVIDRLMLLEKPQAASILTPREQEILVMMNTTATYREIGRQLSISEETVRSHSKHILSKLGQPNRAAAIKEAERLGLIQK